MNGAATGANIILEEMYDVTITRAIAPRTKPSDLPISKDAENLIILSEVTGESQYKKKLERPIWPGGNSGVTMAFGYDLGYVTAEWLRQDWKDILAPSQLAILERACKLRGAAAKTRLGEFSSVSIPWSLAAPQFRSRLLPLYVGETIRRLPNAASLPEDSRGALVSLVYNRGGGGFQSDKPQYREMREIRLLMNEEHYEKIPTQIRKMKHLWDGKPEMKGLLTRRELEARLFEQGLQA
ncbi:hypothetical protein C2L66_12175 [Paraburkholderia caribensis]|nr:hypothetical protein C2L66_12175 [Paraburkholderia caribensis]